MSSCYYSINGSIQTNIVWGGNPVVPCGSVNSTVQAIPCCTTQSTCMSHGICSYPGSLDGGSGYYAAGCTDPSFSGACAPRCGDKLLPDVVYEPALNLWACCTDSSGNRNCPNPSTETFNAPAPADLLAYFPNSAQPSSSTTSTFSTSNPTVGAHPTSSLQVAPSDSHNSNVGSSTGANAGLSTGAKAGIGVGAGLGGLAGLALLGALYLRWRRRQLKNDMSSKYSPAEMAHDGSSNYHSAPYNNPPQPMLSPPVVQTNPRYEMATDSEICEK